MNEFYAFAPFIVVQSRKRNQRNAHFN